MGYIEQTDIGNVYITNINDWFATLSNLNSECKNYIDSEIRYKEILAELKKQIKAEVIEGCAVAFNELAIKWFNQGCIALGDIPRVVEELKEQL